MSYPRDLDETSEEELSRELERRARMRQRGLCDYCGRAPQTPACKFPERHASTGPAPIGKVVSVNAREHEATVRVRGDVELEGLLHTQLTVAKA